MPKKTKAIKHTDKKQQKAWLRKPKTSKYIIEKVEQNKTVLIVCEGQTEKLYFESFEVLGLTVKAIDLGGQAGLALIEVTTSIVQSANVDYDEIWCVFDMDVHKGQSEFADYDNAINKASELHYKVAYSNDAFELWFYLHYQFTDEQHHQTFYYEQLSKLWNINYEKAGKKYNFAKNIYQLIIQDTKASQKGAIKNARKLHTDQKDLPCHKQNPVTTVYLLVEMLNQNLRP